MSHSLIGGAVSMLGFAVSLAVLPDTARAQEPKTETIVKGLQNPWGLAFLPDGRMLVTERPGRLRIINPRTNALSAPITGLPAVAANGQGGLLGLALDPEFASNRQVYLCFAEGREGGTGTSVFRGRLSANFGSLDDGQVIFRQMPAGNTGRHFGCRLVFGRDQTLFITLGDRGNMEREAQNLANHIGKVIRIRRDGSVPPDNPFVGREGVRPEIWSYGHRNIQGATLHPETGLLYTIEHGARGGDEVNQPQAGKNYGWPVITYGVDYSGARIGEGQRKAGMEQPLYYWDPSIAPSGAAFYTGDRYPRWKGALVTGALAGQLLSVLEVRNGTITGEQRYLERLGERIRDVVQGPDGYLYLLTDARDGAVLRLVP
jgi:glucose/arabinose dehydrogenase